MQEDNNRSSALRRQVAALAYALSSSMPYAFQTTTVNNGLYTELADGSFVTLQSNLHYWPDISTFLTNPQTAEELNYKKKIDKAYTRGAAFGFFRTCNLPETAAAVFAGFLNRQDGARLAQINVAAFNLSQAEKEKLLPAALLRSLGSIDAIPLMQTLDEFGAREDMVITPKTISIRKSAIKDLNAFKAKLIALSRNKRTFEVSVEENRIVIDTWSTYSNILNDNNAQQPNSPRPGLRPAILDVDY